MTFFRHICSNPLSAHCVAKAGSYFGTKLPSRYHCAAILELSIRETWQIHANCCMQVEEEFMAAIRKQGSIRRTTFEQGLRYMEFTEAVTRSIQTGCTVKLPLLT